MGDGALSLPPLVMIKIQWLLTMVRSPPGLTPTTSAGDQPLLMGLRDEQ